VGLGESGRTCRIEIGDSGSNAGGRDPKGDSTVTFQPSEQGRPYAAASGEQGTLDLRAGTQAQGAYLNQAFFWMFAGLLLTAAIGYVVQTNEAILSFVASNFFLVIIVQFALVMTIQFGIRRLPATLALGLFFAYAASLGFTVMAIVLIVYDTATIATAFFSAAAMFGGAALYGYTTKRSLASLGGFLFMALIGLIVASVVNLFVGSDAFGWLISIFGVGLFTVLTAFHVQRIANGDLVPWTGSVEKAAVLGATLLYLDFVNLFLFLLRLFGGGRR
jgi:FtsH-binding integral membrane protein